MPTTAYFVGERSLLIQCAELYRRGGHRVSGVISQEPSIVRWARGEGIPVLAPSADWSELRAVGPFDYLFSVGNLRMLPEEVLALPRKLAINFHDGSLPRHAGVHATTWAIIAGEESHGVTWHEMSAEPDTGAIIEQELVEIAPDETSFSLNTKCYGAGIESFERLVDAISLESLELRPQDLARRTYHAYYDRPFAAATLPWHRTAAEICALGRALDFGTGYENPVGLPKIRSGAHAFVAGRIEATETPSVAAPGTVVAVDVDAWTVASADRDIRIAELTTLEGESVAAAEAARRAGITPGSRLDGHDGESAAELDEWYRAAARSEEWWARRLRRASSIDLPYVDQSASGTGARSRAVQMLPPSAIPLDACVLLYLARLSAQSVFDVRFTPAAWPAAPAFLGDFAAPSVPLRIALDERADAGSALARVRAEIERSVAHGPISADLGRRFPGAESSARGVAVFAGGDPGGEPPAALSLAIDARERRVTWIHDPAACSAIDVARMQRQLALFADHLGASTSTPLFELSLVAADERDRILGDWNATSRDYPRTACVHQLFARQATETPGAIALVHESESLTYAELDARANRLARHLIELGVGPDRLVGVSTRRNANMVVAVMAVLKAGGAYVPLDPSYPRDRLNLMATDAGIAVLLTEDAVRDSIDDCGAAVVCIDADGGAIDAHDATDPEVGVEPSNLAYVIYTSGSTGRPKGVMVEHRNVVNFFAGMDEHVPHSKSSADASPGTWLSVTSLSFDISVLEIFWTLARGFTVVIYGGEDKAAAPAKSAPSKEVAFSLFYFASDESAGKEAYRLLFEGAKFADAHGFEAVWTPERHFHAFGGLYPNASVTSAALAASTENVKIRAGSCVVVLHSPIRVAEEWSLVDNISGGRVGISFASGWQPNDFVLAPANFANRAELLYENIETVHKLWRGEPVAFRDGTGKEIEIRTLPRPIQRELPTWVTAAGNPETFRRAGAIGANILTHLLGQSVDEVAEKIAIYRKAWREGGHPGEGQVTLMLHTFLGTDAGVVRETVREPMKSYLRSSVGLIQKAAWSFPAFKQSTTSADGKFSLDKLTDEELDTILDFSFERYYETSALFGTVDSCSAIVDRLRDLGVDEIACLVDFGVPAQLALDHLPLIDDLRRRSNEGVARNAGVAPARVSTIGELIERHGVTHLQCTPSMASMLLASDEDRRALASLDHMFVGGEAMPASLAEQLIDALGSGDLHNMYGPTETTIWSSVHRVTKGAGAVSIGRPIANTQIYILDSRFQLLPEGVAGELSIGGDGVVRGYLNRPELSAERFIPDPFSGAPGARLYRTGDLARFAPDGTLEFLGRMDHQVKVRGYRIELGEIEALIIEHPRVAEAVVVAREDDPGDKRLVGYFIARGAAPSADELRSRLRASLPDFMVPAAFVEMHDWPLTPNLKIDRKALPAPAAIRKAAVVSTSAPVPEGSSKLEKGIASIWRELLNVDAVGLDDNFFDLGGHSLLTVQVHSRLKSDMNVELSLVDLFRFPTIKSLASHIDRSTSDVAAATAQSANRGRDRRESLMRRARRARG